MEEPRLQMLARQHGIREKRDDGGIAKTFAAYLRRADENILGRALVESAILRAASRGNASIVLREDATMYKVDTEAIAAKVKQEFAAKERENYEEGRCQTKSEGADEASQKVGSGITINRNTVRNLQCGFRIFVLHRPLSLPHAWRPPSGERAIFACPTGSCDWYFHLSNIDSMS